MDRLVYRPATTDDASQIARLHAESWRSTYRGIFLDEFLDGDIFSERLATWQRRLTNPRNDQLVLVCADRDTVRGFICVYEQGDAGWGAFIDNLHVTQAYKGSGIGTNLLRYAALWSQVRRPQEGVYLWVLEGNSGARRFYEHRGAANHEAVIQDNPGGGRATYLRYVWADTMVLAEQCAMSAG